MDTRETTSGGLSRQSQGGLSRPSYQYNPLHEMQEQMRRMDALFNRVFGFEPFPTVFRTELQQLEPDMDVYESNTEYIIHAALPGVDLQDIKLEVTEDSVVLTAHRRSPFDTNQQGNGSHQQPAQAGTNQTTGGQSTTQSPGSTQAMNQTSDQQTGTTSGQTANEPHTHHRHSRHSAQMRYRLVYTLPTPINPDAVSATFRNGMLDLHLPKHQATTRTVPITITADGTQAGAIGSGGGQGTGQDQANEGNPANKMGQSYTPSPGEDHTTQAQSIGARADHEPGRQGNPVASGQTNPMGTTSTTGTPAETKLS